ncbi:MAG TPA: tetratricopeptide repeat protein [Acidobacteriota bacterium]|jgi:tetratricopeptide (TPR) repeat protein|nr:tetratricopeptide repeat protein [Acidobacteriota bacterium]HNT99239.1 tetratricopeptide repeat protein [Acidobacteriota bacterium]
MNHRVSISVRILFLAALLALAIPLVAAASEHEAKGDAAFAAGDYKKAVKEFKKAVGQFPNQAGLHYKLAQAYFKKGEAGEAMAEFIRTTNLDPNHDGAYQYIGDFFYTKGEMDKAVRAYENLVRINSESARYHYLLGKTYDRMMRNEEALQHLYKTILLNPAIEDAYPLLFKILKLKVLQDPGNADSRMILGRVYKLHGDLEDAKNQFAVAVQMQPGARDTWEELLAVCRSLKDCKCEIAALDGLLSLSADRLALIDQILEPARRCELRETLIRYLEQKIALAPDHGASYAELGRLFQQEDNRIQAYFYFRKYTEVCRGCPDYEELRTWCANEELANPLVDAQYRSFNTFQAGVARFKDGRFPEALRLFDEAESIYPSYPQLHFFRGQVLEELDRRGEALYAYKEAIKIQPSNAEYWFFLGKALDAERMREQAAVCFMKVLEVDSDNLFGYHAQSRKLLQSYKDQGIIKPSPILE